MTGNKKPKKSMFSWSLPLLRKKREGSEMISRSFPLADNERGHSGMQPPIPPWSPTDEETTPETTFQKSLSLTDSVWSHHEKDHFDGSPKVWKQSRDFFCDATFYPQKKVQPSRLSVANLEEDMKNWLESLSRKSQQARERFNYKIMSDKNECVASNYSFSDTRRPRKPNPPVNSPFFQGKSSGNDLEEEQSILLDNNSDSISQYSDRVHLIVPHLGPTRNAKSPNRHRPRYDRQMKNSKSSLRLVSAWSADTLSLLVGENQDDSQNLPPSSQALEGEGDFTSTSWVGEHNVVENIKDDTNPPSRYFVQLQMA